MARKPLNMDNLMMFSEEEDTKSFVDSGVSWLSVLSELDQQPATQRSQSGTESSRSLSPNIWQQDSTHYGEANQPVQSVGYTSVSSNTFFGFPGQITNDDFQSLYVNVGRGIDLETGIQQTPNAATGMKHSLSQHDVSPTDQSVAKAFGFEGNNPFVTMETNKSSAPPPLPPKTNKYLEKMEEKQQVFQSSLQVVLSRPEQPDATTSELSSISGLVRTDSMSSTGSFHPYDSISLRRNLSSRSIGSSNEASGDDRGSPFRRLKQDLTDGINTNYNDESLLFDLSLESKQGLKPAHKDAENLQVKLPDLDKEEKEFFGQSVHSRVKTLPQPAKKSETHRYSIHGEQHVDAPPKSRSLEPKPKPSKKEVFLGGGLFEVAKERNAEIVAFGEMLSELRSGFPWFDTSNRGYVVSPALRPSFEGNLCHQESEILVVIYTEGRRDTIRFVIDSQCSVKDVLELSISCLSNSPDVNTDNVSSTHLLKICGKSEYLESGKKLVEYEYIQECLKFQKEVQFVLVEYERVSRLLSRVAQDDEIDSLPRSYKDFFDLSHSSAISQYGLSVLLEAYTDQVDKVMEEITNLAKPKYEPSRVIQSVKAICAMLASIETDEIHAAIDLLNELKKTPGQLGVPRTEAVENTVAKLTSAVFLLIEMYCEAFDTDFSASKITRPGLSGTIDINSMSDHLRIHIASAHRIPLYWRQDFDSFEVDVGVYYGGCLMCPTEMTTLTKVTRQFCDYICWNEWLQFDILVKQLPRESRLCLTLYGIPPATKGSGTARTPLGWVAMQVFTFKGVLVSGTQLLGLWPDAVANPVGACTSNLLHPSSVLLLVEFERYLAEIIFPDFDPLTGNDMTDHEMPQSDYGLYEDILAKDLFNELKPEEKIVLWEHRYYCRNLPRALPLVLSSAPSWEYKSLHEIYTLLSIWTPMSPVDSMELLKVNFPDRHVRSLAVRWMSNFSDDELCDYLPQLVQALKYEIYHDSALVRFLVRRALGNVRLMHHLFWYLKDKISEPQFGQRFQVILGGLLNICGEAQKEEFTFEDDLVMELIKVAQKVKAARDSARTNILQQELAALSGRLCCVFRLPLTPSLEVVGLDVRSCGYFTSNSAPLRLIFKNVDPFGDNVNVIFKMGDDMRQDTLTMQLVGIMNKIWLREGLDLKMITYQCMATGPGMGMIEIVSDSQTLREIHTEFGLTGSFKDESINRWLMKNNPDEKEYRRSVENFTESCAGYCVATYVLGICDRHNDNIMIRHSGHLFHIDFARILGHAQMFGNFRRDRAPFVLTPDMAYVINGGYRPSSRFQHFIDLCCRAFNLIRRHANLFLNLLSLMLNSGIMSLGNVSDLKYIRDSLLPHESEAEATAAFTRLIESSLSSWFTQVNFFIHNVAQIRDVSQLKRSTGNPSNAVLSFALKTYTIDADGFIESARVVDYQKRYNPDKYYIYVINICRVVSEQPTFVFRRFSHFQELHTKLAEVFPDMVLPRLPARIYLGRSQIRTVAERRRAELDAYLRHLLMMPREVSESDVLYTFLHPIPSDEEEAEKFSVRLLPEEQRQRVITGQIKLSIRHERQTLRVMVMHAKDLSQRSTSTLGDPYVKLYLLPDPGKDTKLKTKIAKKTLNPTYNETLVYSNRSAAELKSRQLQVSVWDHDRVGENEFMGGVTISLADLDLQNIVTRWYPLTDIRTS